jgi:predicted ATP-grasp superfamily ATP-dependent carboligase
MPTLPLKPPLAIVGASTRSAAASAVRAGFQPLAADLFADADLRPIATTTRISPYPEGLADWLRTVEPPAWMYTGALENHPELVDQMAWIAPLLGNPGDVLARVRSPWELAAVLRGAGLLFPETRGSAAGIPHDGSWLMKTYRGASGSGVRVWSSERGVGSGHEAEPDKYCYQKRVDGTPCAAVFVASEGLAQLLGVTRQLIGEPWLRAHGFQYAGSIGPWPISAATCQTLEHIGNVLSEQFELVGLFGVDFILDGQDVWTIEVNPRYTASVEIVERCTGVCAIAFHVAACNGTAELPATHSATACNGKAILFAARDVAISKVFAEYSLRESLRTPWPALGDVPSAGTHIEADRPILTAFAKGSTIAEVERRLHERVAQIEREVYTIGRLA